MKRFLVAVYDVNEPSDWQEYSRGELPKYSRVQHTVYMKCYSVVDNFEALLID